MVSARGRLVYNSRDVQVRFKMDRQGMAAAAVGPELTAAVMHLAEHVAKPYAIGISPRSAATDKVHYQDSFVVVPGTAVIRALRRVAARLYNLAPHATHVEVGSEKTEAHRVLFRTLDHLNTAGFREHN